MSGPLAGLRVVDLSTVVAGPLTTRILADLGADVIKVESKAGDIMRWTGPGRHVGMGALFMHLNRGKRGIVLDLKAEEDRERLLRLCESADLFFHNIRPAAMRRLRLDYPDVAAEYWTLLIVMCLCFVRLFFCLWLYRRLENDEGNAGCYVRRIEFDWKREERFCLME